MVGPNEKGRGCPSQDDLVAFHRGWLADLDLETVASHLSICLECESFLGELAANSSDDSLSGRIRQFMATPASPPDPAYLAMERAAKAIGQPDAETPSTRPIEWGEMRTGPKVVGPYEILAEVDRGGMGVIYRARHQTIRREVALKMIRAGVHAKPEDRERFETEGAAVARLRHPNVVEIYEFGEAGGLPYFAMEWVDGGSLADRLEGGPLSARAAAELVRTIAYAVESAHGQGIIHRDLKPSNVLLTGDGTPKISDFGLAKFTDETSDGLTPSEMVMGTPSYMAPEQAEGRSGDVGPAADVYALGAILFAALTGEPPFKGSTKIETLRMVREDEPVPPSQLQPGVPVGLEMICLRCLDKAATRRYRSAQALAENLDLWLRSGRPGCVFGRLWRWQRTLRRRWRIGLMGLVLPLGIFTASLWDPDRQIRQVQGELKQGRAVALIEETGRPAWFRWRSGQAKSQWSLSADRAFTIHTWGFGLLELLPNTETDRYRFDVEVRHWQSELPGRVGLFLSHQAYPSEGADIQFFVQLAFNDVRHESDVPAGFPDRNRTASKLNAVTILPRIHSEEEVPPNIDFPLSERFGPRFIPAGEGLGGWHRLSVIVTPEGIEALWDGQPSFRMTEAEVASAVESRMGLLRTLYPNDPTIQALQPKFLACGGLGLYLSRGSASFRAATVTPLAALDRPDSLLNQEKVL